MRRILIGVLAATMFVAACGGGSSSKSGSGNGSTGGGSDAFSQLTAKAKSADIKITFTNSSGSSATYAQDGTGKTAYITGDNTVLYDGTNSYSCGGTGADATCTQLPGSSASSAGAFVTGLLAAYAGINSSVYGGRTSSDTIAGRDATCVTFKASDYAPLAALAGSSGFDASAQVVICADKETGFLLKLVGTSNNKTENVFLATAVDKSSSSDFTPPVTPSTLAGGGGGTATTAYTLPGGVTLPGGYTVPSVP